MFRLGEHTASERCKHYKLEPNHVVVCFHHDWSQCIESRDSQHVCKDKSESATSNLVQIEESPFQETNLDAVRRILPFTDYFRFPHVIYFDSIPDLLTRTRGKRWFFKGLIFRGFSHRL